MISTGDPAAQLSILAAEPWFTITSMYPELPMMFASSPGLHAVEHPIYDVWLTFATLAGWALSTVFLLSFSRIGRSTS